jgi:hypothetical protein
MLTKAKKRGEKKKKRLFHGKQTETKWNRQHTEGKVLSTHWKKKGVQFGK